LLGVFLVLILLRLCVALCVWPEISRATFRSQYGATLMQSTLLGSHDSLTYNWSTGWTTFLTRTLGQTQFLDITSQLGVGVRYFDIRVKWDKRMQMWYGCHVAINRSVTFDSALLQFGEFLDSHPDELIVLKVKQAKDDKKDKNDLETSQTAFRNLVNTRIGKYLVRGSAAIINYPIRELLAQGKQIVWIDDTNHDECLFDPFQVGENVTNATEANDLYSKIYSSRRPSEGQLAVLQWIPSIDCMSLWSCSQNTQTMSVHISKALPHGLPTPPRSRTIHNVVMIDYVC
jgi:hypothetical protein